MTTEKQKVRRMWQYFLGGAFKATLGRGDGVVAVPGKVGYVYCRKLGREDMLLEAYNRSGSSVIGTSVLIRPRNLEGRAEYEVIASSEYVPSVGNGGVTSHAELLGVLADQHHAQAHTLGSHSTKAHAELTAIGEPFDAHLNNPRTRVYRNATQSIPNNAVTAISFNIERFDTDNIWVIGSPTVLTCRTAGVYQLSGTLTFANNNTGLRVLMIQVNGTSITATRNMPLNLGTVQFSISTLWEMSIGNTATLAVYQNSGGALNVTREVNNSPEFGMVRVG